MELLQFVNVSFVIQFRKFYSHYYFFPTAIVCNELEAIANGIISYAPDNQGSEYNLETVATYSCNDGFVLVGPNETRNCVEVETFGEFNGVAPICERKFVV